MGGPLLDDSSASRRPGPSSFGGIRPRISPPLEKLQWDFAKFGIADTPRYYEYYAFSKGESWRVAQRNKIAAPQAELEKLVSKSKRTISVLEALKKMSPLRRAQIDRLLDEKNLNEENEAEQWHCVFIESPNPEDKQVGDKRIREHKTMNVIIARGKPFAPLDVGAVKSFGGEWSDINEPLRARDKVDDRPKPSKGIKAHKDDTDSREDPFDTNVLFDDTGVPLDNSEPIWEYAPQPHPFSWGMEQRFAPPRGQPMGSVHPTGSIHNPDFRNAVPPPAPAPPPPPPAPGQQLPPNRGQQLPPNLGQQLPSNICQHLPPNLGQQLPSNIGQHLPPNIGQHLPPNIGQQLPPNIGQHLPPNIGQQRPPGIEIMNDPVFLPNGMNRNFRGDDELPPQQTTMQAREPRGQQQQQLQRSPIEDGNGSRLPLRKPRQQTVIIQASPKGRRRHTKEWNDDSGRESDEDDSSFEEDGRSSHTSYGDEREKLVRRGSLVPQPRHSLKRREPAYREHRRRPSYAIEEPHGFTQPRGDSRYHDDRVEMIIERRPRRRSSRERRDAIKYVQPRRVEYQPRTPPLTPVSSSSHSSARRLSGYGFPPHETEHEDNRERWAEDYIRDNDIREHDPSSQRWERQRDDRHFDRSADRSRLAGTGGGQRRYW